MVITFYYPLIIAITLKYFSFPCTYFFRISFSFLFSIHGSFKRAHQKLPARKTMNSLLHLVPLLSGSVYLVATWEADWKCKANCERESESMFASVRCSLDSLLSFEQRSAVVCELYELRASFVPCMSDGNYCRLAETKYGLLFLTANILVANRNTLNI